MKEFCQRAIVDTPKGLLLLVLGLFTSLLRHVEYPFLQNALFVKPLAQLIAVTVCMKNMPNQIMHSPSDIAYKNSIGKQMHYSFEPLEWLFDASLM